MMLTEFRPASDGEHYSNGKREEQCNQSLK